uniref:Aminotransferase-like plant mobile domain-containing protein n=1 Tax=Fagus sylvatica TaxID=28930 RepID=A0A2N9G0K2_FAGSY
MASSSFTPSVSPSPPSSTGERPEIPLAASKASTEAVVDATAVCPSFPGEATSVAPPSFSDETGDPREGFVFPLVDPWSEAAVDQAWVPSLDEVSELLILKGNIQSVPINFDFLCAISKDWSHWVDLEIVDLDFWDSLRDAGVHWSILISRSCNMFRDTKPLQEEEIATALRRQSSTRLSGWPSHFMHCKEAPIRRATFILYWFCKCTFGNSPYYLINTAYIPLAIKISTGHCFPLAPLFFGHLYLQLDLLHDCEVEGDSCYILHASFNTTVLQTFFWEHSASYLFAAKDKVAAWSRFSHLPQEFLDRFLDFRNNLPLVYRWVGLKTHDHDLVTALNYEENVLLRPYGDDHPGFTCVSVFSRFYQLTSLIHDLRADNHRSLAYLSTVNKGFLPVLSATGVSFIPYCPQRVQRQFGLDKGSEKTPISVHRKRLISYPCLSPHSQSAISYANSQKLGFAERDEVRGGWIAYTIHLPQSWRSSVNVVEDRLIMLSKRGKRSKRDALVDLAVEKASKKPAPSPKKTPPKKMKVGKKGKSTASVSVSGKKSTAAPIEAPFESTATPSKAKDVAVSSSKKKYSKKSVATRPPKGQRKARTSSSSPDEEPPSTTPTRPPSKKKKLIVPPPHSGAASHTRSKSGFKQGIRKSGRPNDTVVDVEMTFPRVLLVSVPLTTAMDQDEDLARDVIDNFKADIGSIEGGHSVSSESFFDATPSSIPKEQMMSAGFVADDDDMLEADDSNIGAIDLMRHDLAIVPHASHSFGYGRDDDSVVDSDVAPLSFSVPQTVLTSRVTGSDASMAYIMEGVSLFGVTSRLRAISASDFVISASRIAGKAPLVTSSPIAGGVFMSEEVRAQGFAESESVVDLGVIPEASSNVDSTVDHGAQAQGANASAVDMVVGSEHLENIGMDDTVHMSEDAGEVGITGEITVVSPPPRPTAEAGFNCLRGEVILLPTSGLVPALVDPCVIQDLMEVEFDLAFMIGRLRQTAQHFFGKRISDEVKALQHQIVLLQDSLAVLTAYKEELVSTGRMVPGSEHGRSLLDSLLD